MSEERHFQQSLNLFDATMIVAGSMIGSGIFIVSADISRNTGSPFGLLFVWGLAGFMTLIAALSYGELAGMMPKAGGQYIYLREAYNPLIGFLYGWTLFAVIQTGTIAAVAVAFSKFISVFFPALCTDNILFHIGVWKISAGQLFGIALVVFLTYINSRGIRNGKHIQTFFTSVKIVALLGIIIFGIITAFTKNSWSLNAANFWSGTAFKADGSVISPNLLGFGLVTAIGVAMVGSLFSSDAWNNVTFIAGEIKHPEKNIPRSLLLGTLIVTTLYISANFVYLLLIPFHGNPNGSDVLSRGIQFAQNDRVGTAAATVMFGQAGNLVMAAFIVLSTFACNNGLILAGARVYYAMAKDGLFFKQASTLNRCDVPAWGLWAQCIWASALCLSGTYSDLLTYTIFAALLFYIISIYGIFILRRKQPDAPRPYKAWGYPFIPALYIILASLISLDLFIYKPDYTWPGLGIILIGIPIYFWQKNKTSASDLR